MPTVTPNLLHAQVEGFAVLHDPAAAKAHDSVARAEDHGVAHGLPAEVRLPRHFLHEHQSITTRASRQYGSL